MPRKKKPAPKPRHPKADQLDLVRPRSLTLQYRHQINGVNYGPGTVKVRGDVAAVLAEQETRAKAIDDDFYDRGGKAYIIGGAPGKHSKHPVPYSTFDADMGNRNPGFAISGR